MSEEKDNDISENNPETRNSIDHEQYAIYVKHEAKNVEDTYSKTKNKYRSAKLIKSTRRSSSTNILNPDSSITSYGEEDYHIAICQDGKFVATLSTANLQIKILENTDLRYINDDRNENDKMIVTFKINNDFTISKEHENINIDVVTKNGNEGDDEDKETASSKDENFRWSIDISNICTKDTKESGWWSMIPNQSLENKSENYIFVAVSRMVDEDMKKIMKETTKNENGITVIYRVKLNVNKNDVFVSKDTMNIIIYNIFNVSGICRFVHKSKNKKEVSSLESRFTLRRFLILNFDSIHSFHCKDDFNLYKKFEYPPCIRRELDALDSSKVVSVCKNLLFSCLYGKYFLVEHYKDNIQLLEVYDLELMKLETITKRVEKSQDKLIRKYNRNNFAISKNKQLLCFTRGLRSVKLYFMNNGLEAISKKFNDIEKIYLLEFIEDDKKLLVIGSEKGKLRIIIWNMYNNFGDIETIEELDKFLTIDNLATRLARTSGNLLQVDDNGIVSSVLKNVKAECDKYYISLNEKYNVEPNKKPIKQIDEKHTIYYHDQSIKNFEPIVTDKEPWVSGDYERTSYCLYRNEEGSEIETLQLIVGRTTIQVWHQIQDTNKNQDSLPNKGEPFLEYIWTNGIPVNQERRETRLRIDEFKYGLNISGKLNDFYLKVYWYERVSKDDKPEIEKDNNEIDKMEKNRGKIIERGENQVREKVEEIRRQDIIDKVNAVRHACKALEFINKRTELLVNYTEEHLCEEMVAYITRIIWRFIKYKPDDFRLLDVRRNVMKYLILGDCDQLVKFMLFGNDDNDENINKLHIPRNTFWKKSKTIIDDTEEYEITNVMELAIHHCKGREIRNTIIVAYLLEYYSRHAIDYAGWMSTVSKALPLLFKYNYDDYIKKLFRKECFVNQNYLSALNIIPEKFQERHNNHGIKFRTFEVNLRSNKINWYSMIWKIFEYFTIRIFQYYEGLINKDAEKQSLALRVVPLPEFTVNYYTHRNKSKRKILFSFLLFLFIPRWYEINWNKKNNLSPFSRAILYENHDDIYDNPATEAIIGFRWAR
ncbi:hypothetical protein GLOIN_2v1475234 [Rhizophagus clarus]|uniref:Uncharacterized protein n=1 Tax=Rhizophagus clarus TaxID=94130 RepID=A0A8H3L9Z5_9GLOM|nr:hypothetical protein GLOIN_2v1475234 [Rhizophagus clarus]